MQRARGFTLVELVVVIMLAGVLAATLTVFLRPAVESWLALRSRSDLSDQAATALRTMQRDVRLAVPNSIRIPNAQCFELVPTVSGGRFRRDVDPANDPAGCTGASCSSRPLDLSASTTEFDVLTPMMPTPAVGDWVVIDNQNPGDVYSGDNRSQITAISSPPATWMGRHRITVNTKQFPPGYDQARFVVVPNSQQSVFFVCAPATDANGDGAGTLVRVVRNFTAAYPSSCPATAGQPVLATNVRSCRFVYDPNQGATQQSGFVSMQLELRRNGETVKLLMGRHVLNVP